MNKGTRELLIDFGHSPDQRLLWAGRGVFDADDDTEVTDVNVDLARKVVIGLAVLDAQKDAPIILLVHSGGGYETSGFAIYDAIASCRSHVTAIVIGEACSMASIFIQAADHRVITPNSWLMIHDGTYDVTPDRPEHVGTNYRLCQKWDKQCRKLLNSKANVPHQKLTAMLKRDTWLDAETCVEMGFVDAIADVPWHKLLSPKAVS